MGKQELGQGLVVRSAMVSSFLSITLGSLSHSCKVTPVLPCLLTPFCMHPLFLDAGSQCSVGQGGPGLWGGAAVLLPVSGGISLLPVSTIPLAHPSVFCFAHFVLQTSKHFLCWPTY